MPVASVNFTGSKELQAIFAALPAKAQKKMLRHAFRVGAKLVKEDAKRRVPVDSGALRDTLYVRAMKRSRTKIGVIVSMPGREELARAQPSFEKSGHVLEDEGYYPAAVEYGTSKVAARPFLRPALKGNELEVRDLIAEDIRAAIDEKGAGE